MMMMQMMMFTGANWWTCYKCSSYTAFPHCTDDDNDDDDDAVDADVAVDADDDVQRGRQEMKLL